MLYIKPEKYSFAQQEVSFLNLRMVKAIENWLIPKKVTELRSFLGLANYYRKFIKDYFRIAAPLSNLLKKDHGWE